MRIIQILLIYCCLFIQTIKGSIAITPENHVTIEIAQKFLGNEHNHWTGLRDAGFFNSKKYFAISFIEWTGVLHMNFRIDTNKKAPIVCRMEPVIIKDCNKDGTCRIELKNIDDSKWCSNYMLASSKFRPGEISVNLQTKKIEYRYGDDDSEGSRVTLKPNPDNIENVFSAILEDYPVDLSGYYIDENHLKLKLRVCERTGPFMNNHLEKFYDAYQKRKYEQID